MARWMIVYEDMTWYDIFFTRNGNMMDIESPKEQKRFNGIVVRENTATEVYEVTVPEKGTAHIIDMEMIDRFFEANNIVFGNRTGLHREIRRYITFSLK